MSARGPGSTNCSHQGDIPGLGVGGRWPDLTGAGQAAPWMSADCLGVHLMLEPETLPHRDHGSVDGPVRFSANSSGDKGLAPGASDLLEERQQNLRHLAPHEKEGP